MHTTSTSYGLVGTTLVALVSLFSCLLGTANGEDLKILMIGNSYVGGTSTARDVTLDLQGLFDADPQHSADVTRYAVGGGTLKGRVNDPAVTGPLGFLGDPNNAWDVVILQERSLRPGLAMKNGGSNLSGLDDGGPVLINDYVKQFHPQAEVLLYNTWARELGNQDLIDYFNNDPNEMLLYTNLGYDRIRAHPGSWDHSDITEIARVGDAWQQWYKTYGYGNNATDLHDFDGSHQNNRGSYLAAAVMFEMITGTSTVGSGYSGAVTGSIGGDSIVSLLQQQATDVTGVGDSADFDENGIVDGLDFLSWQRGVGIMGTAQLADGDANGDGNVDADDLVIWEEQYVSQNLTAVAVVPEPTSFILAITVVSVLGLQFRRRMSD